MTRVAIFTVATSLGLTTLFGAGLLSVKRDYDDMMFVPKSRDRTTMAKALHDRFGSRIRLLNVPVVNRDVNGIAGIVEGGPPTGIFRSEGRTFSFERLRGRAVCLMTFQPWELAYLRRTFLSRAP